MSQPQKAPNGTFVDLASSSSDSSSELGFQYRTRKAAKLLPAYLQAHGVPVKLRLAINYDRDTKFNNKANQYYKSTIFNTGESTMTITVASLQAFVDKTFASEKADSKKRKKYREGALYVRAERPASINDNKCSTRAKSRRGTALTSDSRLQHALEKIAGVEVDDDDDNNVFEDFFDLDVKAVILDILVLCTRRVPTKPRKPTTTTSTTKQHQPPVILSRPRFVMWPH